MENSALGQLPDCLGSNPSPLLTSLCLSTFPISLVKIKLTNTSNICRARLNKCLSSSLLFLIPWTKPVATEIWKLTIESFRWWALLNKSEERSPHSRQKWLAKPAAIASCSLPDSFLLEKLRNSFLGFQASIVTRDTHKINSGTVEFKRYLT